MNVRNFLGVLALTFLLTACAKAKEKSPDLAPPPDQSSAEETKAINATLARIEALTVEVGDERHFRSLPIIVRETADASVVPNFGACIRSAGKAQYILLKKEVFVQEKRLVKMEAADRTLFRVLLHEIGHCYFGREHDNARIESEGQFLEITSGGKSLQYMSLDVSAMAEATLVQPSALDKYYVAELLGLARATSPDEIKPFAEVKFVAP
jgi:hypothetical protein